MYYIVLAIFLFGYGAIYRFIHSAVRPGVTAIRRQRAARRVARLRGRPLFKQLAFVLSAAVAGYLAGATKAMVVQLAKLIDVSAGTSGEVALTALIGGLGTDHRPGDRRLRRHPPCRTIKLVVKPCW